MFFVFCNKRFIVRLLALLVALIESCFLLFVRVFVCVVSVVERDRKSESVYVRMCVCGFA